MSLKTKKDLKQKLYQILIAESILFLIYGYFDWLVVESKTIIIIFKNDINGETYMIIYCCNAYSEKLQHKSEHKLCLQESEVQSATNPKKT